MTKEEMNAQIDREIESERKYYARERIKQEDRDYRAWAIKSHDMGLLSEETFVETLEWATKTLREKLAAV